MPPNNSFKARRLTAAALTPTLAVRETTPMLKHIKEWLASRKTKPLNKLLSVEFDETRVVVRVLEELDPEWNQTFLWQDIKRVCFKDGGLFSSDLIYLSLSDREKPAVFPTEAEGGHELFGAICARGLFPEHVWRKAVGDTSGGLHCWPTD